ncbi:hypothetical protein IE53DRAFT_388460 [Violaceomyces palustris]|uniref:Uncharacterized protein n=1 Tax=Violaceomyces palustris TaxID=1673888 RepID=A0ACD0NUA5_9BASI|nr:hypothetical protein IE53DRAFT_388460 [Violaceomyces palustris]
MEDWTSNGDWNDRVVPPSSSSPTLGKEQASRKEEVVGLEEVSDPWSGEGDWKGWSSEGWKAEGLGRGVAEREEGSKVGVIESGKDSVFEENGIDPWGQEGTGRGGWDSDRADADVAKVKLEEPPSWNESGGKEAGEDVGEEREKEVSTRLDETEPGWGKGFEKEVEEEKGGSSDLELARGGSGWNPYDREDHGRVASGSLAPEETEAREETIEGLGKEDVWATEVEARTEKARTLSSDQVDGLKLEARKVIQEAWLSDRDRTMESFATYGDQAWNGMFGPGGGQEETRSELFSRPRSLFSDNATLIQNVFSNSKSTIESTGLAILKTENKGVKLVGVGGRSWQPRSRVVSSGVLGNLDKEASSVREASMDQSRSSFSLNSTTAATTGTTTTTAKASPVLASGDGWQQRTSNAIPAKQGGGGGIFSSLFGGGGSRTHAVHHQTAGSSRPVSVASSSRRQSQEVDGRESFGGVRPYADDDDDDLGGWKGRNARYTDDPTGPSMIDFGETGGGGGGGNRRDEATSAGVDDQSGGGAAAAESTTTAKKSFLERWRSRKSVNLSFSSSSSSSSSPSSSGQAWMQPKADLPPAAPTVAGSVTTGELDWLDSKLSGRGTHSGDGLASRAPKRVGGTLLDDDDELVQDDFAEFENSGKQNDLMSSSTSSGGKLPSTLAMDPFDPLEGVGGVGSVSNPSRPPSSSNGAGSAAAGRSKGGDPSSPALSCESRMDSPELVRGGGKQWSPAIHTLLGGGGGSRNKLNQPLVGSGLGPGRSWRRSGESAFGYGDEEGAEEDEEETSWGEWETFEEKRAVGYRDREDDASKQPPRATNQEVSGGEAKLLLVDLPSSILKGRQPRRTDEKRGSLQALPPPPPRGTNPQRDPQAGNPAEILIDLQPKPSLLLPAKKGGTPTSNSLLTQDELDFFEGL